MARINKQEVLQEMQEGLRLDTAKEKTPQELAEKILPVYKVNPRPRIFVLSDNALNDSDKTITVPAGKQWEVLYGQVQLVTTATVGDRRIQYTVQTSGGNEIVYTQQALNVQIASTNERYNFGTFSDVLESVPTRHNLPLPVGFVMLETFELRILDVNIVAAAADDLTINLVIKETDMNPNR